MTYIPELTDDKMRILEKSVFADSASVDAMSIGSLDDGGCCPGTWGLAMKDTDKRQSPLLEKQLGIWDGSMGLVVGGCGIVGEIGWGAPVLPVRWFLRGVWRLGG